MKPFLQNAPERVTIRDFDLTTAIYQLDAFKVVGEREGSAAAITEKRNANNVKDVVAMDQFGNLPNLSTGEVVMRLPGVAGSPSDEGISGRFMTRGMDAALNTVTVDGSMMTTQGLARNASLGNVNATMFEAVELIKGQTPDKGADSLGGTLNLSYCKYAIGGASTLFDYQNTTEAAAYIWDFRTWDNINNRKQMSLNLKTEYRANPPN